MGYRPTGCDERNSMSLTPQPMRVNIDEAGAVSGAATPTPVPLHLANCTPGSVAASQVVMADANGNVNFPAGASVSIAGSTLAAAGVSTATTATTAELDTLHGMTATTAELNYAADVSARTQGLTASGVVATTTAALELAHNTVAIVSTIASAVAHQGLFTVKNTSASGTASHTCVITTGTWDGTHKIATFAVAASLQCLVVVFDSAGNGTVVSNTGTVALS